MTHLNYKLFYFFLLTNIFFFIFLNYDLASAQENLGVVKLRADEWCPYNCSPNSKNPGLMIEVAQQAFGKNNVDYDILPWKRAIIESRNGKYDGIVGANYSDAPDFIQSYSLGLSVTCFYTKSTDNWNYTNHSSIYNKRLGYIGGYGYPDFLLAYIEKTKVHNRNTVLYGENALLNLLKMVVAARVDIVIDDQAVVDNKLSMNPELKSKVKNAGCATEPKDVNSIGISFSPKTQTRSQLLVKILNSTIENMIKNGKLKVLLKKYHMKEWW